MVGLEIPSYCIVLAAGQIILRGTGNEVLH
jgi:hypothetical protein